MDKIRIEWIDSKSGPNEWEYLDDLEPLEPVIITTIGFLVEETPDYKTNAHSMSENQVVGRITIPTACIRKRRRLK